MITRRDLFSITGRMAAGSIFTLAWWNALRGRIYASEKKYDLVAVKGGNSPVELFNTAISQMGGMQRFIKKGGSVLIKPNIGWDRTPEYGATTNPDLVAAVVRECYTAGAAKVYMFDHTCDQWQACYKKSGMQATAVKAGAELVPASSSGYFVKTSIPGGRVLKEAQVHKLFLECDSIINIPVLKHHSSTVLTASMKNLMGVVWDRGEWHRAGLHQCIADFSTLRRPDLVIIDGWRVMTRNGPRGYSVSDVQNMKYLFMSADPVAADSAAAMVLAQSTGIKNPTDIRYIKIAGSMGLGRNDLAKLNIKRITI
ncbi:MAG: DUF362 domain-containing protein [Spirochaetes bacterium]|nr:DUF362 domain-containing protein [Spirochaetota bacterium]